MLGAIIGDIVGSAYEFNPTNDYDFEMFKDGSDFTDDTICTIAVANALLYHKDYGESIHQWCRLFPNPKGGYGGRFRQWVTSDDPKPYNSLGNGSAMRCSPIAWAYMNLASAMREAEKSASCTHNHPEGIKGAEAVVMAIHFGDELRRLSKKIDRETILKAFEPILTYTHYDINIRRANVINKFDETCPGTVPVALWIITESNGFEDAIRKAVSLGADADTLGAIVGSIAEAIWGIPEEFATKAMSYLPEVMKAVVNLFYNTYSSIPNPLPVNGTDGTENEEDIHGQTKAMMLWKLGLGHMGKFMNGEDPMPSKVKRATLDMWKVQPMPDDDITKIPMYYEISAEKMRILRQGHIPESQEDHWFMVCGTSYIQYFRSWTGTCEYVAHYKKHEGKYIIDSLTMNHELAEFAVNGDEPGKALFLYLISSETDGFNHMLWQSYLDAWEKQYRKNIKMAEEREKRQKEIEEYRRKITSSLEQSRKERERKRIELTEGTSLFKETIVAGTQYIEDQHIFYKFEENDFLTMKAEPDNKYDENSVALYYGNDKVGYVPRKDNKSIAALLRKGWDRLFVVYVSDWHGCGKTRKITIRIMIRPSKPLDHFTFDKYAYEDSLRAEKNQLYFSTGGRTGTLEGRTTPERIDRLDENEVFVFGSNKDGHHMGGAAAAAMKNFGAKWGQGDGLQGQSYAISTMEGLINTARNVNRFISFAAEHQELRFYVTPIGCGIAGFNPLQIAPLFSKAIALPNVFLPEIFWEYFWMTNGTGPDFFNPDKDWKKWDK